MGLGAGAAAFILGRQDGQGNCGLAHLAARRQKNAASPDLGQATRRLVLKRTIQPAVRRFRHPRCSTFAGTTAGRSYPAGSVPSCRRTGSSRRATTARRSTYRRSPVRRRVSARRTRRSPARRSSQQTVRIVIQNAPDPASQLSGSAMAALGVEPKVAKPKTAKIGTGG